MSVQTPEEVAELCAKLKSYDTRNHRGKYAVLCREAAALIEALAAEVEQLRNENINVSIDCATKVEQKMAAEADAERFVFWFSDAPKDVNEYLKGVREHWTTDQWRAWIDAALAAPVKYPRITDPPAAPVPNQGWGKRRKPKAGA